MIFPVAAVLCFVGRWMRTRVFCQLLVNIWLHHVQDMPGATSSGCTLVVQLVKESACSAGDLGSIPGLGRSPGEGKGYPLQYSGLENSMDCVVHGVAKSGTRLSDFQTLPTAASPSPNPALPAEGAAGNAAFCLLQKSDHLSFLSAPIWAPTLGICWYHLFPKFFFHVLKSALLTCNLHKYQQLSLYMICCFLIEY